MIILMIKSIFDSDEIFNVTTSVETYVSRSGLQEIVWPRTESYNCVGAHRDMNTMCQMMSNRSKFGDPKRLDGEIEWELK